jgi:hypothetical protein
LLWPKNTHVLKQILNAVITEIEALLISGSKFLYAAASELSHVLTVFSQLLIIVEAL